MKLFRAFCQGKSILIKDTQKLTKYIDLCLKTPVAYKGIQNSIGYHQIMIAQFNSKKFNQGLFPQFINLIGRDFKELDQNEFNYFMQALSCYVESAINQEVYDKQIFENVINQISLHATYVQKCLFFTTIYGYIGISMVIPKSRSAVDKFQAELFEIVPQTVEERLWRVCIEFLQLQQKNAQGMSESISIEKRKIILDKLIGQFEEIEINLPKFTNIMSRLMLLTYFSLIKQYDLKDQDKKVYNLLRSIYTNSHNYILKNISSLNSFEFVMYINLSSRTTDLFQSEQWKIILNEINSKDFNEMPIIDVQAFALTIIKNQKMPSELGYRIIQQFIFQIRHLYENMNSINSKYYAEIFTILYEVECDLNDKFVTKLQQKVVPKDLPLDQISLILRILKKFHRIDQNILEKYLVGIGTRIKDIDKNSALGILSALNCNHQENPPIFQQILKLKLDEEENIQLQIEIIKYLQMHDPQNEASTKVQERLVRSLNKKYDFQLICSFLEVLLLFNQKTLQTITVIPELKQYLRRGLEEIKRMQSDQINNDVMEFLIKQYQIET